MTIVFPDLNLPKEIELVDGEKVENFRLNDSSIMKFAKCLYCVRQVADEFVDRPIGISREESVPPAKVDAVTTTSPVSTLPSETTTVMTVVTNTPKIISGDANNDNTLNVRDCSVIANALATGKGTDLPDSADYNKDGNKNVRDAAAIARDLAEKIKMIFKRT